MKGNLNMKCVKDCWQCELEGCPYTLVESYYLDLDASEKPIETPQQKATKKYNKSQKHKEALKRWKQSEKGREYIRQDKRKYYSRNREKVIEKSKLYYKEHAEEIKRKRRERYKRKKTG